MAPAAFKETVSSDRTWSKGYVTGEEADCLVRRSAARRRGFHVAEYGIVRISPRGSRRAVELTPVVHPKALTERQFDDLLLIEAWEKRARILRDDTGAPCGIDAGFFRVPRVQTGILLARGWLSQLPHTDEVWISAAGRTAMAYRWHRQQGLPARVLKDLYLDAVLTAAEAAGVRLARFADPGGS